MDNQLNSPRPNYQTNYPPRPNPSPEPSPSIPEKPKKNKNDKTKRVLGILSIVFATIAAFGAGYYIQALSLQSLEKEVDTVRSQNSKLEQQLSSLKENSENNSQNITTQTPELIPGAVDTNREDNQILVGTIFKGSLNPTEIWVEYGTNPTSLDKTTDKSSEELGLGDADQEFRPGPGFLLNNDDLEAGVAYYFRVGATVNGDTLYSSVAGFNARK